MRQTGRLGNGRATSRNGRRIGGTGRLAVVGRDVGQMCTKGSCFSTLRGIATGPGISASASVVSKSSSDRHVSSTVPGHHIAFLLA